MFMVARNKYNLVRIKELENDLEIKNAYKYPNIMNKLYHNFTYYAIVSENITEQRDVFKIYYTK